MDDKLYSAKRIIYIENCGDCKQHYDEYYHFCKMLNKELDTSMVEGVDMYCPLDVADQNIIEFKKTFEKRLRKKFRNIINGKGLVIPRIVVKMAIDDLFKTSGYWD